MQARQLMLPEIETGDASPAARNSGAVFSDPAFATNKQLPVHRWVPWIAGFSRDFVCGVLREHLTEPGVVLDPFAGVGTTLVEAMLAGHAAIGFEINPYAALACRTKLQAYQVAVEMLYDETARFRQFYHEKMQSGYTPQSSSPRGFKTRSAFYSPQVLHKVLLLHDFIQTIPDTQVRELFLVAFAATMVRYSNYSYEPSLGRRASAGKEDIHDFPVAQTIIDKLTEMAEDIAAVQATLEGKTPDTRVVNESFFRCQEFLQPAMVDLIITSPPYLNNYHYNRNTRPQLYWLGFAEQPQDLKALEAANFGKYWQTVREQSRLELEFVLPDSDIAERIQQLRSLNTERGIYGGNGWANYAAAYFNDCYRFAKCVDHALKPGGTALIVIGNSILQGILMPTDQYLGKIAEAVGLELVRIDIPRTTRVGNSIIQSGVRVAKAQDKHQLYEAVVELRAGKKYSDRTKRQRTKNKHVV
jgi:DNA modification methylase